MAHLLREDYVSQTLPKTSAVLPVAPGEINAPETTDLGSYSLNDHQGSQFSGKKALNPGMF